MGPSTSSRSSIAVVLALLAVLAIPLAAAAQPRTLVLGADENASGWNAQFAALVYGEASKRLGIPIRLVNYPLARYTALEDTGEIDGDAGRVLQYGEAHPNLIRIEESILEIHFALFAVKPNLNLKTLDDLRGRDLVVDYRRGVLFCERALKPLVAPNWLNDLTSETQGARKLLAGRADLYCDIELTMRGALAQPDLKNDRDKIYKALDLGSLKLYPYLHKKNADLVPRLAAVLKQMRAEGLLEAYRVQMNKQFGIRE